MPKTGPESPKRRGGVMQHILIVDDQLYLQELFASELTNENYRVSLAFNIEEAMMFLDESRPDLVILDLYINGLFSWDLIKYIKNKYPDLPVLILTAYDNFIDDPRASQADGYLVKNYENMKQMCQSVHNFLNRRNLEKHAGKFGNQLLYQRIINGNENQKSK